MIIAITGVIFYLERNYQGPNDDVSVADTKKVTEYYVLVTNYFSEKDGYEVDEMKDIEILVLKENESAVNSLNTGSVIVTIDKFTELIDKVNKDGSLALIPWSKVTPSLKTMKIDGKYFWETEVPENYPFRVEIEIPANEPYEQYDSKRIAKINFLGDIMLSRTVNTQMEKYGFDYPWKKTKDEISNADITFANLEVPISNLKSSPSSGMSFIAPTKNLQYIKGAGIDVVSVANNHSANFGYKVFTDNLANLKKAEVGVCGGGLNEAEARKAKIIEVNKIRFAFLCQSAIVGSLYADETGAGVPYLGIEPWYRDSEASIKDLEEDIKKAKEQADVVIVSPHWGVEYKHYPNNSQNKVARRAVDAGADMIVGTHPHVVQASEFYNDKYISYSLGNFIFDQEWSLATKQGTMLSAYFYDGKNVASNLHPLEISNYSQPSFVTGDTYDKIISTIKQHSVNLF